MVKVQPKAPTKLRQSSQELYKVGNALQNILLINNKTTTWVMNPSYIETLGREVSPQDTFTIFLRIPLSFSEACKLIVLIVRPV
jgi:hypothetical protein